ELDLGASRTIYSVDTHFYSNDSRHYWYKVKVSNDGQNWTYLAGDSSNQGWVQTATSPGNPTAHPPTRVTAPWGTNARYVRVYGNGNSINTGNHVYEIEVWGDPEPNKPPRLMPGEWHAFQVAASNQVGWSDVSPLSVGAQVITTPSAPRNLSLNVDDNYMEVW